MTRKLTNPCVEDGRSRKRILKPVVEKKRRDRINQSLAELRSLLLNHTSDPRLQNPKIEKAEILDLTVEYMQKWTDAKGPSDDSHHSRVTPGPHPSIQTAGFQQCMAQLSSYMSKIPASQRSSLMEGLTLHTENQQQLQQNPEQRVPQEASALDESSRSPFLPQACSTPSHDYLTPPTSPWFSSSLSTYAASPPFPSLASHFPFPPSLSPPSSNTSVYSLSPTGPHTCPAGPHFPWPSAPRSPLLAPREVSQLNSPSSVWRPWF